MSAKQRPGVWVGHIVMNTPKLDESEAFMQQIGLRPIFRNDKVAVLELRGGTHLVVIQAEAELAGKTPFDFMVEDLHQTHADFKSKQLDISDIQEGTIHDSFEITEPGGNQISFNSTHVDDHGAV